MNAIEIVYNWMLTTTVRASVLAVVIFAIQLVFRRWLPAGWRHALWLPLLAVLILPVLPSVPFGLSVAPAKPTVDVLFTPNDVMASASADAALAASHEAAVNPVQWNVLSLIWITGACGLLTARAVGYRKTMQCVKNGATMADSDLLNAVAKAASETNLSHIPSVIVSNSVQSPAVTGLFRPVMLLPIGFLQGFSATESRLILLHECAHLKRHDLPINWLTCLLHAVHWFNPVLWLAFIRMSADREAACDARVLSMDTADCRAAYGGALLKLQSTAAPRVMSMGFVGIFERNSEIKSRIYGISQYRSASIASRITGAVLCALLMIFGATKAQEPTKSEPPQTQLASPKIGDSIFLGKIRTIIIPQIRFENITLEEAVDFIRQRSVELDKQERDPAKKGINFVIRQPRSGADGKVLKPYRPITLNLKNATLEKVIQNLAEQSGARYKVDDFCVRFEPVGEVEDRATSKAIVGGSTRFTGKVADEANKIIIPNVDLEDVSLKDAVEYLNQQAKKLAKTKPVVQLVIDPKVADTVRIRELRLRNVPLAIAATYYAEQTRLHLVAGENEIRFTK